MLGDLPADERADEETENTATEATSDHRSGAALRDIVRIVAYLAAEPDPKSSYDQCANQPTLLPVRRLDLADGGVGGHGG
jgi:hypothetical protein